MTTESENFLVVYNTFLTEKTVVVTEEFLVVRQICFRSNIKVFLPEKRMSSKRELFDLLVVDKNFFVTEKKQLL